MNSTKEKNDTYFSDGQGFRKPHRYTGTGTEGKGQGTDLRTLEKPIPSSRVVLDGGYMGRVFMGMGPGPYLGTHAKPVTCEYP